MKLIIAVIKPFKLDAVRDELSEIDIKGMTVTEVKGCGRQKGHSEIYRGAEYVVDLVPKVKLEIVVHATESAELLQAAQLAARTGRIGDGKIFCQQIDDSYSLEPSDLGA